MLTDSVDCVSPWPKEEMRNCDCTVAPRPTRATRVIGAFSVTFQPALLTASSIAARIRAAIEEAVRRAGWKVTENAPITLVARVGRGATVQSQFRISSFGQGLTQSTESVSMTPYTASIDVFRGQQSLWNRATVNRMPSSFISFRGNGTAQEEVRKAEVPDYGFFESLQLPRSILRPEVASAVKTSTWVGGKWVDGDR